MTGHLLLHPLGMVHVLSALAALFAGALVLVSRKGNRRHRWLGRTYLASMLALNVSSLMIFEVFDGFGAFHWMALISLASVLGGYVSVRRKSPGWKAPHAYFMVGSYVGLVAAAAAEIASRVPGWSFGPSVALSSAVVIVAGVILMLRLVPRKL